MQTLSTLVFAQTRSSSFTTAPCWASILQAHACCEASASYCRTLQHQNHSCCFCTLQETTTTDCSCISELV
jgi:hypothetical protein